MKRVFLLYHTIIVDYDEDKERMKLIGVFSERDKAKEVVKKLIDRPGFKDYPDILEEYPDENGQGGFYISSIALDTYSWQDGFG